MGLPGKQGSAFRLRDKHPKICRGGFKPSPLPSSLQARPAPELWEIQNGPGGKDKESGLGTAGSPATWTCLVQGGLVNSTHHGAEIASRRSREPGREAGRPLRSPPHPLLSPGARGRRRPACERDPGPGESLRGLGRGSSVSRRGALLRDRTGSQEVLGQRGHPGSGRVAEELEQGVRGLGS